MAASSQTSRHTHTRSRSRVNSSSSAPTIPPPAPKVGHSKSIKPGRSRKAEPATTPIRILIADDHPLIRDGLRGLLVQQPDFVVIGEASHGDETLRLATDLNPDVVLLDLSMPKTSGLDIMRELARAAPRVRTIIVTARIEKADLMRVLQHGVRGVVLHGSPTELLFKCIRKVASGEVWIRRETVTDIVDLLAASPAARSAFEPARKTARRDVMLTPREREILQLIVEGESNKGIAQLLSVSQDTVKHHLTSVFNKTGTSSRLGLALFALDSGLVKKQ